MPDVRIAHPCQSGPTTGMSRVIRPISRLTWPRRKRPSEASAQPRQQRARQVLAAVRSAHVGMSKLANVSVVHMPVILTEHAVDSRLVFLVLSV